MDRILISNFKAIRNTQQTWIQAKPMTVLMGAQASGKSTLAKLLYFFKTLPDEIISEMCLTL